MSEDIKDIIEILELAKEEIENNDENITVILDLQDLKSLKNLYELYQKEIEKNKELEHQQQVEIEGRKILVNLNENLKEKLNKEKLNSFILSEQLDKEKEKNIPLIIDEKSINAYADEIEDLLSIEDGMPVYFSIGERRAIKIISQYCRNSIPKDKIREKIKEWDKGIAWANADDHYYAIKILQEILNKGE